MASDAVVFGAAPVVVTERLARRLAMLKDPFVVAADGGAATAFACGCVPQLVVGDLDSIPPETLETVRRLGIALEVFPRDKDMIDGELALDRALDSGARRVLLVGFLGGSRLDMTLANVALLSRARSAELTLTDAHDEVTVIHGGGARTWQPEPGELVSLIPAGGAVDGVATRGLRWPLANATLALGETRGVSNEPTGEEAVTVSVRGGTLLVVRHYST